MSLGKDRSSMAKRARKTTENEVECVQLAGDFQLAANGWRLTLILCIKCRLH